MTPRSFSLAAASALLLALSGCGGDGAGTSSSDFSSAAGTTATSTPIAYAKRVNTISANPTNGAPSAPGGDILIREQSSPSAPEHNITTQFTQGVGDASGPEVSYDGKKLLFAMRCPASSTVMIGTERACTGHWNIWEYDMSAGSLTNGAYRRLTSSSDADDVDPAYLPGNRGVVFTSNRQTQSRTLQALGRTYDAHDEYERERVFNLHTMDAEGGNITQITFNQSHDRSPVVRQNGEIMFSHWDHVGGRNHFKIFRVKPDGTDLFVLYGAHSEGNSFLHPREMDPNGSYKGFVASDLMPLSRTHEGGALVFVDAVNYSEQHSPANTTVPNGGTGQTYPVADPLNFDRGISVNGRITTPYPLWDGTDRLLVAYTPCQLRKNGVVKFCSGIGEDPITEADLARLSESDRLMVDAETDPVQDNVPPSYAIYMFDPARQTWSIIASPPEGYMYTHPVALAARDEPSTSDATAPDETLKAANMGRLEVRSVYDTDELGRMGDAVLLDDPDRVATGCATPIPKKAPTDAQDTRPLVADLVRMKDPLDPAYGCAPARFIRVVRAVAPPDSMMGMREAIGITDFEMQQILGYVPIEPDGSFRVDVPADTPIALAVIDSEGRAFQTHTNWIQVRPGERRTCDGCHSPRRGGAINAGAVADAVSEGIKPDLRRAPNQGKTMATIHTTNVPALLQPTPDMVFNEYWADTSNARVVARASIALTYAGLEEGAKPVNGIINYPEHIQPLWTKDRGTPPANSTVGADTCTNCHNAQAKRDHLTQRDLSATRSGTGRLVSYEDLMTGDPVLDARGMVVTAIEEGVRVVKLGPGLVDTGASEGEAMGLTRKSRLAELIWGQNLAVDAATRAAHPTPSVDHARMLNASEKRLLAEWMDTGAKYYNDPFDPNAPTRPRVVNGLSEETFKTTILPILNSTCGALCHQAVGSGAGTNFRNNRFVLTGGEEGDYNMALTLINDACSPDNNALLKRPSTVPHPTGATGNTTAILPSSSTAYATIKAWIQTGCAP
jgi:hypothetical protein